MSSPQSFMVGNAPQGAGYAGRLMDFSSLRDLGADYYAGQKAQREQAAATAFPNGIPLDARGQPDVNTILNTGARIGGLPFLQGLLPFLMEGNDSAPGYNTGGAGGTPAVTSSAPAGPVSSSPSDNHAAGAGPGNLTTGRGENILTIVGRAGGDPDDPRWNDIAKRMGVEDATTPLSPAQARMFKGAVARLTGQKDEGTTQTAAVGDTTETSINGTGRSPRSDADNGGVSSPSPAPSGVAGAPGPVATPPGRSAPSQRVAQGGEPRAPNVPEGMTNDQAVQQLNQMIAARQAVARRLAMINPQKAQIVQKQIDDLTTQRNNITDFQKNYREPTGEQKNLERGVTEATDVTKARVARGEKVYSGLSAAADQYERGLKEQLDVSRAILNTPGVYTGVGAERYYDLNKVKAIFGEDKAAMLTAALEKVRAQQILSTIGQFRDDSTAAGLPAGRMFQTEMDQIGKASASITTPLAGNRFLIEMQTRVGEQSRAIAKLARDYLTSGHNYLDVGFDARLSEYLQAHPIISEMEQAHPELVGAPSVPAEFARAGARGQHAWAQKMDLEPGSAMRLPNGKYVTVPGR